MNKPDKLSALDVMGAGGLTLCSDLVDFWREQPDSRYAIEQIAYYEEMVNLVTELHQSLREARQRGTLP